jgi:hypothetical protein
MVVAAVLRSPGWPPLEGMRSLTPVGRDGYIADGVSIAG